MKITSQSVEKYLDSLNSNEKTKAIEELKQLLRQKEKEEKERFKQEYDQRLAEVLRNEKFPDTYAIILEYNKGLERKRSYAVKNKKSRDMEVLEAFEELVR